MKKWTSNVGYFGKIKEIFNYCLGYPYNPNSKIDILKCGFKVIYPKYSKHWLSSVAHTIDCVCGKILNHGLNHGLMFSLFEFFGWKDISN